MGAVAAPAPRSSFARYWTAAAISSIGSAVTAVAMPVLVVQLLGATPFEVGVVNAAQFVPYALLGLTAGAYTDRWRRKPILVWASVGRALALGAIPILWLMGVLQIWILVLALLLFGAFSVSGSPRPSRCFLAWYPERDWLRPMHGSIKQTPLLRLSDQQSAADSSGSWEHRWRLPSTRSAISSTQHSTRASRLTSPDLTPAYAIFARKFATACSGRIVTAH